MMKPLLLATLVAHLLVASAAALPSVLTPRAPDFLDDLPGVVEDIVTTTVSVVRALKEAIKDDALVRNDLAPVLEGNDTAAAAAACPDVAVLFARGAKEPGNVGFLAGPPLFQALETYINGTSSLAVQGVNYTSSSSSRGGAGARMAELANRTAERCPGTGIAMAGYSLGAGVVRRALAGGTAPVMSVVLFGDPREGTPVEGVDAAVVRTFCHEGDLVCRRPGGAAAGDEDGIGQGEGEDGIGQGEGEDGEMRGDRRSLIGPHLDYSLDAPAAAMFVMQRSGLGVASEDAMDEGMEGTVVGMVQQIMKNADRGIASRRV